MEDRDTSKKKNISNNAVSITTSLVFFLLAMIVPQPFLHSVLVYDYDATSMSILIWNVGLQPATDVLIEIIPQNNISFDKITPSTLEGELITEYSKNNTTIFHIYHIYNKEPIEFTLSSDQKINQDDIKIIIRSNEGFGIESNDYWKNLITNLQVVLLIVATVFGITVYFFVSWLLEKYRKRQN